jgi:hypothetical protein
VGFALWIDETDGLAWAQGTHEYRPLGTAVLAVTGQFRNADFRQSRRIPPHLSARFVGFFGSLESVNEFLSTGARRQFRRTPAHLL